MADGKFGASPNGISRNQATFCCCCCYVLSLFSTAAASNRAFCNGLGYWLLLSESNQVTVVCVCGCFFILYFGGHSKNITCMCPKFFLSRKKDLRFIFSNSLYRYLCLKFIPFLSLCSTGNCFRLFWEIELNNHLSKFWDLYLSTTPTNMVYWYKFCGVACLQLELPPQDFLLGVFTMNT